MRFLTLFIAAAIASNAWAQFVPNEAFIYKDSPINLEAYFCKDQTSKPLTGNALRVCQAALEASEKIAEDLANSTGKYIGCLEGTHQGLRDGFDLRSSPSSIQQEKADLKYQSEIPTSAQSRATEKANTESSSQAVHDVIQNYRDGVKFHYQGVPIEKSPQAQTSDWEGFTDGYDKDYSVPYESDLIKNRWITAQDEWMKKLAASVFYNLHIQSEYSPNQFCVSSNGASLTLWDYFLNAANTINFKLKPGKEMFQMFLSYSDAPGRKFYDQDIKKLTNKIIVQVQVPQPAPPKGSNQPGGVKIIPQTQPVEKEVPIDPEEATKFRNFFQNVLVQSYDMQYKLQKFSPIYLQSGEDTYLNASIIGNIAGPEYAIKFAEAQAYNNRYKEVSRETFIEKLNQNYQKKFNETVKKFENNAVLELLEVNPIGSVDDGEFLAGEDLLFEHRFNNLGEKSTTMMTSVLPGTYIEKIGQDEFDIPPLTSYHHTTQKIARIKSNAPIGTTLPVTVSISGGADFTKEFPDISTTKTKSISVHTQAQIRSVQATIDLFTKPFMSKLNIYVNVYNPTTHTIEMPIKIKASLEGYNPAEIVEETLLSETNNGNKPVYLFSDTIDTLELIKKGSIKIKVETYIGDQRSDEDYLEKALEHPQRKNIVAYFSKLSQNTISLSDDDIFNLPDSKAINDRIGFLRQKIDEYVREDIRSGINWKKPYEVDQSVLRIIQSEFNAAQGSMGLYMNAFESLGQMLAKHVNDIQGSKNRKKYLTEIQKFAPGIKDHPRDYK
jgi:hypothetical protein